MTRATGQAQHTIRRVLNARRHSLWSLRPILWASLTSRAMCRPQPFAGHGP